MKKQWYEELFEDYARGYEKEVYTTGTKKEVDFFVKEIGSPAKSPRVLDIGCGTGRHSVELARRGYDVTGIDLSDNMLSAARRKAEAAGLDNVTFLRRDARSFRFWRRFDAAVMICEGAFSLMETDRMNWHILKNAARSLKRGGVFIFTCLSALFPMAHSVEKFLRKFSGKNRYHSHKFDWLTLRETSAFTFTDDSGRRRTVYANERYYMPSEIAWMLTGLGFRDIGICGARLGAFSRKHALTPDDFELLVVARKDR